MNNNNNNKNNNNKNKNIIFKVLEKAYISDNNYDSTSKPFFFKDNMKSFKINYKNIHETLNKNIPESLNRNIKLIYNILGEDNIEIYLNEWTIMSINKALERYNVLCNNGRSDIFDIGFKYEGLGYITVLSCDLNNHLLFYRLDGGSNGYDREYNFNNLLKNGSKDYEKFYFSKWFYNIKFDNNNN
tara:strand:+ start:106 stop:663 length:558 start_codon:yes stop_codon:yes gene_type:complete